MSIVPCDLSESLKMDAILKGIQPDVCIHLAWQATVGSLNALSNVEMMTASLHLARCLASCGCKKMVVAGTCFEYDLKLGYFSESSPTKPHTLYAATKLGLYYALDKLSVVTGMKLAWLRLFYLYGPFEDKRRLVPSVITSLLSGGLAEVTPGEQIRDYLHVEDAASAMWAVAASEATGVFNVGSGIPVMVKDVVHHLAAVIERNDLVRLGALDYRQDDPMFICANNKRLVDNTKWEPKIALKQGLRQTIDWWRCHTL